MAHQTQITGAISELTAAKALMEGLGWEVAKPLVPEVYDFLARDPISGAAHRVQVKTLRIRADRANALVVVARKGNGEAYTSDEVDYIVGIDGERAFMFECRGCAEYWSTEQTASKRWVALNNTKAEVIAV